MDPGSIHSFPAQGSNAHCPTMATPVTGLGCADTNDTCWHYTPDHDLRLCKGLKVRLLSRWNRYPKHTVATIDDCGQSHLRLIVKTDVSEESDQTNAQPEYIFLPRQEYNFVDTTGTQHHFRQFPVGPAYAITSQIVQGSTCRKLFWDVTFGDKDTVSHGTTYVIPGRVRQASDLGICGRVAARERETYPNVVDVPFLTGQFELNGTIKEDSGRRDGR